MGVSGGQPREGAHGSNLDDVPCIKLRVWLIFGGPDPVHRFETGPWKSAPLSKSAPDERNIAQFRAQSALSRAESRFAPTARPSCPDAQNAAPERVS